MRYIWVDALCIVQDDMTDKSHHLAFMDQVYRYAELTLIAASGKDANAGLPGLREPRDIKQRIFKVQDATAESPGIHIITAPTIRQLWQDTYFSGTEWSTRGWTLQERAMSRRSLVFTDTEVFWSCGGAQWAEGLCAETQLTKPRLYDFGFASEFLGCGSKESDNGSSWDDLGILMTDFASRNFGVVGDAYSAFSGILAEFSRMTGERFLWALPVSRFEIGICWHRQPASGFTSIMLRAHLKRRRGLGTLPTTTLDCQVPFPSWSWLGWTGSIQMTFSDQYRDTG